MQHGYWVSCYRAIYDADKLAAYADLAKPAIEQAGGQFLVRGAADYASGSGLLERTVIVQWPSLDDAKNAYHSEPTKQRLTRSVTALIAISGLLRVCSR